MRSTPLEPGLIRIFRMFLVVQLILVYVNVGAHTARGMLRGCPWCAVAFGSGCILLLLGYLSWPRLQERLGGLYLPLALGFAAVFSLVLQNLFLDVRFSPSDASSEETAWQLFLFLFIPLVLVGWQYDFKAVIAYCILTAFLDYALLSWAREGFEAFADTYRRLIFIRALSFTISGYVISRIMDQLREQRNALSRANRELGHFAATLEQLTLSRERNRLARELHDTLAHTLSGLAVQLEGVKSLWERDPLQAHAMLSASLEATRSGLTETRGAIQALRCAPLEDLGLELALQELGRSAAERAGFEFHFEGPHKSLDLSQNAGQCLYRVAQEALENAARHAQAGHVTLRLAYTEGRTSMMIHDDGVGFDAAERVSVDHFGLRGMCERAELAGGSLTVDSRPGSGTTVRLEVENHA